MGETAPGTNVGAPTLRTRLLEVAAVFTRLSLTAFGGPAAHLAMMEDEVVRRRGWISREEFLDRMGAASLIPGPTSTEVVIYLGYLRGGWLGLVIAGACFIVPAAVMVMALAWAYVRYGRLPQADRFLYGIKPVVIAIIAHALWRLSRTAVKNRYLGVTALASIAAVAGGVAALPALACAGVVSGLRAWRRQPRRGAFAVLLAIAAAALMIQFAPSLPAGSKPPTPSLAALFLYFAKIGSVLYGSSYRWLTSKQLLDAIVVGQVTPGPLFTTATFIGFVLHSVPGAAVATAGIFFPAFVLCALSGPLVPWLRRSVIASAFLDGVNVAALALMAIVTWQLARTALVDVLTITTALICALGSFRNWLSTSKLALAGVAWALLLVFISK